MQFLQDCRTCYFSSAGTKRECPGRSGSGRTLPGPCWHPVETLLGPLFKPPANYPMLPLRASLRVRGELYVRERTSYNRIVYVREGSFLQDMAETSLYIVQSCNLAWVASGQPTCNLLPPARYGRLPYTSCSLAVLQELHQASLPVICCRLQDMAETPLDILQSCSLAGVAAIQPICNLLPPARYGRDFPRHFAVLQSCRSCIKPANLQYIKLRYTNVYTTLM